MVAGSALMMLCVSMVHQSFRWTQISNQHVRDDQTFWRLQQQFRRDAHVALNASLIADSRITFDNPDDSTVTYSVGTNQVRRTSGQSVEDFRFGDQLSVKFDTATEPERVALHVQRGTQLNTTTVWRRVECVVGRRIQLYAREIAEVPSK